MLIWPVFCIGVSVWFSVYRYFLGGFVASRRETFGHGRRFENKHGVPRFDMIYMKAFNRDGDDNGQRLPVSQMTYIITVTRFETMKPALNLPTLSR